MSSQQSIQGLDPALLWQYFYEISRIPRPSKKEEQITAYLEQVFQRLNLKYEKDKVNNLVARAPATKGYEKAPVVVLQGHSDMVCEKNRDIQHDFDKDPIELVRDGEWICARGTTLGADNGIGLAAALAILSDPSVEHGPLEMLVTVDEETGLTGANQISDNILHGKYLLNLDSEEEGVFYIGCAGGMDTTGSFRLETRPAPSGASGAWMLRVSGLKGGHSGSEIHLGRANAIKLLARTLEALRPLKPGIVGIHGGSKRNAIPREAEIVLVLEDTATEKLRAIVADCERAFQNEFGKTDPELRLTLEQTAKPAAVYSAELSNKLVNALLGLPHGLIRMSADIEDLVETSTNLATVSVDSGMITVGTNQRSSVESAKRYIAGSVAAVFTLAGAGVAHTDGYPGWQPNMKSGLLQICRGVAKKQSGQEPEIKAIHAGLECGLLGGKYPGLDMISFGPTITGAHSPDERVHIPSVEKFYEQLKAVLKAIA